MSTFESLREKYGGFSVPAYKISVGGSELSRADFAVSGVCVDLCAGETCGACRFFVGDVYEPGARKILPAALQKLKPGAAVSVSLGYGSSLTQVFFGYISETKLRFGEEGAGLMVYGLDARGLMRENICAIIHKDKKMSDIANEILNRYGSLIASRSCSLDSLELETYIAQESDDLSFLLSAANNRGLLLYMENDKFVIDKASDTACIEFEWGQFEIEFGMKYLDAKITGTGCDPSKTERVSAAKPAKQRAAQAGLVTTGREVAISSYLLGDSCAKIVGSLADAAVREAIDGRLVCRGVPEAALGKKIKITKFPLSMSGTGDTFSVVSVSHRMDEETGFTTTIGITG